MEIEKKTLLGIVNPLGDAPCFCVPVFGTEKKLYYQLISPSGRIEGFLEGILPKTKILRIDQTETFGVGDLRLYAFYFNDAEKYACTRTELSEILKSRIKEFKERPYLQLEIGEFLNDSSIMKEAMGSMTSLRSFSDMGLEVQIRPRQRRVNEEVQRRITQVHPRSFYPKKKKSQYSEPLYPSLESLMDDFFRECDTIETVDYLEDVYIDIPQNKIVGERLLESFEKYSQAIRSYRRFSNLPLLITGRTGVGKSTLLFKLRNKDKLCTDFSRPGKDRISVFVNCLNLRTFTEVIQEMLGEFATECKKNDRIWMALQKSGLGNALKANTIPKMSTNEGIRTLRGILSFLHPKISKGNGYVVPVAFFLDNIDRMAGFKQKRELVQFATRESKSTGFPFFGITLRVETKHAIESEVDDISAIGTHEIQAPTAVDIMNRRLNLAFSNKILNKAKNWSERFMLELSLGSIRLQFEDLRKSLEAAIRTLTTTTNKHPPLIPSIVGTNLRNALTLCRVIIKATDEKGFLLLSKGIAGEHYLIRSLMLEEHGYYSQLTSKIRNMFYSTSGYYFVKPYILRFLYDLQSQTNDFVFFKNWESLVLNYGIDKRDFLDSAWSLMKGNFALIDVEGTDDVIPNDLFKNIHKFKGSDTGVKVNSAGEYYLSRLMFDIAYLSCVLQDTIMDYEHARAFGKPQDSLTLAFHQTLEFLDFLERKETEERKQWGMNPNIPFLAPELKRRIEQQRRVLIQDEENLTKQG